MFYTPPKIHSPLSLSDLTARIGETVSVCGMIHKIRRMAGFAFVVLRTEIGDLQCVYGEQAAFPLSVLAEEQAVRVTAVVKEDARSRLGFELLLCEVEILSRPTEPSPVVINNKEIAASAESLYDLRPVTLRNAKERAIFTIQAEICRASRDFFERMGFTEIHSPKLVSGSAEGGANVFRLDYFGKEAFLAQSPQFYKQMMVAVFGRVYEIAPVFRAEKHDTARHINEYTSIDAETGFAESCSALMQTEAALLVHIFKAVCERCSAALALWNAKVPEIGEIPTVTFDEAKEMLRKKFGRADEDDDFSPEEEKRLSAIIRRETGSDLVFVTRYHTAKRPFYALDCPEDPHLTESFDLIFRGLEVTTGGMRICDYAAQIAKMEARGMDVAPFAPYLQAHKYGLPPHGGFGIGLERLTARLLGLDNVRRATLFPRDIHRLTP